MYSYTNAILTGGEGVSDAENTVLNGKTKSNLEKLFVKEARLAELRICELSALEDGIVDFVSDMSEDGLALYELLPLISEELMASHTSDLDLSDHLLENESRIRYLADVTENLDRAVLSALITEKCAERASPISESRILYSAPTPLTFAYLKNAYSDEAYDVFTYNLPSAAVYKYTSELKEAAKAVFDGECGYCLMPLEEMGTRIASVSELMATFDLKINDVSSVIGFDGSQDMKYAMLSRGYNVPPREEDDDRYLEIRHPASSENGLSDIIFAAMALGHKIYRLNTAKVRSTNKDEIYYSLVLRDDFRDFSAILLYLSLFSPDTSVVGIYKNLE